jgi:hypothetical protein
MKYGRICGTDHDYWNSLRWRAFAAEAAPTCSMDGVKRNPGCVCNDEYLPGLRFASFGLR